MAFTFDETNDYVEVADDAAWTWPDGPWSASIWINLDDLAGTSFQYFFSQNNFDVNNSFNWYFDESPDTLLLRIQDGSGNEIDLNSTTNVGDLIGAWGHVYVSRDASDVFRLYINNTQIDSATNASLTTIDYGDNPDFGRRSVSSANRYFGGQLAEFGKWSRIHSADERAALTDGFAPSYFPDSLDVYFPMIREYALERPNLTVTNSGSTVSDHPIQIRHPKFRRIYHIGAVAAGGANPKGPLGQVVFWGPLAGPLAY